MNDSLKLSLGRLKVLQKELKEKALNEAFDDRVRAAYGDASARLAAALGELDYLISLSQADSG